MAEFKGQNATATITTASLWGNIRIQGLKFRQKKRLAESTGSGSGTDANHVPGVNVRQIAYTGVVIDGFPNFADEEGELEIDFDGTNTYTVSANVVQQEQEFSIDFRQGGTITARGSAVIDGALTINGAP